MILKCKECGIKATWLDLAYHEPLDDIQSFCDKHLPLNCECEDCKKYVDLDENGKRTEPCMNRTFTYNKRGWKPIKDLKYCYEECQ